MSRITCKCGHIIRNSTYPVPFDSGFILCDRDEDHFVTKTAKILCEYMHARTDEERAEWTERYFNPGSASFYAQLGPETTVLDLIHNTLSGYLRDIDQCEKCGRLLVQEKPGENAYRFFKPEDEWAGVLKDVAEPDA